MSRFSAQEKQQILERIVLEKLSLSHAAQRFGISRQSLANWIKQWRRTQSLETKYAHGTTHYKAIKPRVVEHVLELVSQFPEYSVGQLQQCAHTQGLQISRTGIQHILTQYALAHGNRRTQYAHNLHLKKKPVMQGRLSKENKAWVVEQVLHHHRSVASISRQTKISRQTLGNWIKKYQRGGVETLNYSYKKGVEHYKSISEELVLKVLHFVTIHPELSVKRLTQELQKAGSMISSTGVQHILHRYNLNVQKDRFLYAQKFNQIPNLIPYQRREQVPSVVTRLTPNLLPAPPPPAEFSPYASNLHVTFRQKMHILAQLGAKLLLYVLKKPFYLKNPHNAFFVAFAIPVLFSVIAWGIAGYVSMYLHASSLRFDLGFFFSSLALFSGLLFMAYSFKYYFSIIFVLLFTHKTQLKTGNVVADLSQVVPGLQPDVSAVTLDRQPFVSIHLPLYNEKRVVNRLLEAATSMAYVNYEVIVCDDSTDETKDLVQDWKNHPRVKISHRDTRAGYKGAALAQALKIMDPRTEFVLVFDADFLPFPDSVNQFLKYFKSAVGSLEQNTYTNSHIAAVQGYQWHVLNKSENWVTRGVRTEYAGSYVVERSGIEICRGLKQIAGSVFMIRADVLNHYGWQTSITEDFQLTLRLYKDGFKVVYTPYIQAPSECVSTLKRFVRQRMRWAEGHSHNVKRMFFDILLSTKVTKAEKREFIFLAPYYLQSFCFLVGTFAWFIAEAIFKIELPFWTAVWGWSLVLTNLLSLPLMNTVGLFLEESEEKDYAGIFSFVLLSYIVAPFQAYASVKGFLEVNEGPWFRTPKTGRITDTYKRGHFYDWIKGLFGKRESEPVFNLAAITPALHTPSKRKMQASMRILIAILLIITTNISYLASTVGLQRVSPAAATMNLKTDANSAPAKSKKLIDVKERNSQTDPQDYYLKNAQGNYVPYLVEKDENTVAVLTKSVNGIQKTVLNNSSLEITLFEQTNPQGEFKLKAVSKPLFEELNSDWREYQEQQKAMFKLDEEKTTVTISLSTQLKFSASWIPAEIKLSTGFNDNKFFQKYTFTLSATTGIHRLRWVTQVAEGTNLGELNLNWQDFLEQPEIKSQPTSGILSENFDKETQTQTTIFYPAGVAGNMVIDPTLALTTGASTFQIDVANKYRALMNTGDTDDYLVISDRKQNDGSPNATHEFKGPCILETNTYCLRDDANRITRLLEVTNTRIKLRVEGKFNNEASTDYLDDESATPELLTVVEDYTFTPEGVFVSNITDFRTTGVTLDAATGHNGYEWMGVYTDGTDAAYDDTGNIIYGDGQAQSTTTTDGAAFANTNTYVTLPGAGSATYQDAFIGIMRAGWYDDTTGGTHQWYWDENETGTQDLLTAQEQNHLTAGIHKNKWYFLLEPEANLDTQVERESYNNDYRNPDILSYTTGSEWNDTVAQSPGLNFDGTNDFVSVPSNASLDLTSYTIEAWVYMRSFPGALNDIVSRRTGEKCYSLSTDASGVLVTRIGNVSCETRSATTALQTNRWYHVAVTYDAVTDGGVLYVNGASDGTFTDTDGPPSMAATALAIGSYIGGGSQFSNGIIDDVRIWNTVRTATELKENMFKQISATTTGLVGYWRMNENTGQVVHDETTNNNDGTLGANNSANTDDPTWTTGYVPDGYNEAEGAYTSQVNVPAAGLNFDGTSDYVSVANTAALDITGDMTISFWIYFNATTAYQVIAGNESPTGSQPTPYSVLLDSGNSAWEWYHHSAGGDWSSILKFSTVPPTKTWQYITFVRDATAKSVSLYINGVFSQTLPYTTADLPASSGGQGVIIGADTSLVGNRYLNGKLDDLRIYNTPLTATQIQSTMFNEINPTTSGLVSYWKMDENTGQTVTDSTGGHNGTLGANSSANTDDPTWTTGILPATADQLQVDIDAQANVSTLLNGALTAGSTTVTVDSTTTFPASGVAYIDGDKFSYTGTTSTTFTGVPDSGELSVIAHADNTVVASMNRYKPFYKIRGYRSNILPNQIKMEGNPLGSGSDYNIDFKSVSTAYFAQDEVFYAPLESATVDIGSNITNSGCSFVAAKYGMGLECNADSEDATFTSTTNIDYAKGALEFWLKPESASGDNTERTFFDITDGTDEFRFRKSTANDLEFLIKDGASSSTETVAAANYSWSTNDWVHIRLEWDGAAAGGTNDEQRIFINGVEPTHTDSAGFTGANITPGTTFRLGNSAAAGTVECNCIIDEFAIYDFNGSGATAALKTLAKGGDTADADEYLNDTASNQTFSFAAVDASGRGEYLYLGSDSMVSGFNVDLATVGATAGVLNLDWEYWNGTAWANLENIEGFMDGTVNLTQDGAVSWNQNPTNWRPYSVNGSPDEYYIRVSMNNGSGSYSTSPIENTIRTDILLLQYLTSLTGNDQTLIIVPEYIGLFMPVILGGIFLLRKRKRKRKSAMYQTVTKCN